MQPALNIGDRKVGPGEPVFVTAELGINHNGDVALAKQLIDVAKVAGCDAVKFQKRSVEQCIPRHLWGEIRETPWGLLPYLEYKKRLEFDLSAYREIDTYCKKSQLMWFASCWDLDSVRFIEQYEPPWYKVPSACLTNEALLKRIRALGRAKILSTGMSTLEEIDHAVSILGKENLVLLQCTSTYPARLEQLNLRVISTYMTRHGVPVGYSGHEPFIESTYAAVVLGACYVERHITLDRGLWGSDQKASLEPSELRALVTGIRRIESALGDGEKIVYESELRAKAHLRTH